MIAFLRELWIRLLRDDCAGMAAEIAYHWMLALIPVLIFLFSLFGILSSQTDLFNLILENLHRIAPEAAFTLLRETLTGLTRDSSGGLAIISFLAALWTGSNGAVVIEKALNRAYRKGGCRRRSFWQQRLVALFSVLGIGLILLVSANLVVFGRMLINIVEQWWQPPGAILAWLKILRWLMSIGGLLAVSLFIYTVGPERKEMRSWKTIWPGAVAFSTLWICISLLFGAYVTNFSSYNQLYGSMGAIMVLMVWIYFTSYSLLIGAEVNALCWRYEIRSLQNKAAKHPKPSQYRRFY